MDLYHVQNSEVSKIHNSLTAVPVPLNIYVAMVFIFTAS